MACRKLEELQRAGAEVTVVSPELHPDTAQRIAAWGIECQRREFRPADAAGCLLVICAVGREEVDCAVANAARDQGALVNVVDNPSLSDFTLPATVRRGGLLLTVSTGGALPALARRLREQLDHSFGEEYASYLELVGALRPIILRHVANPRERRALFFALADTDLVALHSTAPVSFHRLLERLLPSTVIAELDSQASLVEGPSSRGDREGVVVERGDTKRMQGCETDGETR